MNQIKCNNFSNIVRHRKIIGARIKQFRIRRGFSQKELALRVGIDPANYSRLEAGKRSMTLDTLYLISCALGCFIDIYDH